jgi:hypothetical protein
MSQPRLRIPLRRRHLGATALAAAALVGLAPPALGESTGWITLMPYHEVPSVSSAAEGSFKAVIDDAAQTIAYTLNYSDLEGDVRQAHIHLGQTGASGGIMVWLCQTATNVDPTGLSPMCPSSGSVSGVIQAASVVGPAGQGIGPAEFAEVVRAIRSGVAYVNVHSSKFPAGELRGQLRGGG